MNDPDDVKGSERKSGMSDEYLRAVTVGERKPLDGTIHLAPYDPDWPRQFSLQANRIREALSEKVLLLEHVGSTSVPGLSAKPVIDMVLAVSNSADEPSYVPPLESQGFVLRIREPDWFQHRLLKAPGNAGNLHVFSAGCEEIDRMLAFRDWLRMHDDDRRLYEETKRELAARTWKVTQNYADAKSEVVRGILSRALSSHHTKDLPMSVANKPSAAVSTERLLSAKPREVFAAFEQPDRLAQWWGPSGFTNTFEQFEFEPGGRWVFVMHGPNGASYPNESVFREIQRDTKIVIEHVVKPWFRLTVTLTPRGDKTHLAWIQEFESPEVAATMRRLTDTANEQNLDRLQSLLATEHACS